MHRGSHGNRIQDHGENFGKKMNTIKDEIKTEILMQSNSEIEIADLLQTCR